MKMQEYSLEDIFSKNLLLLIPFYIFSHEKNFKVYNSNEQKLAELKAEYQDILERLDKLDQEARTILNRGRDAYRDSDSVKISVAIFIGVMNQGNGLL